MIDPYNPYEPHLDRIDDAEQMRREREEQLRRQQERVRQQEQERLRQQEAERQRHLQEQQHRFFRPGQTTHQQTNMKPIHLILCGAAMLPLSAHAQFIVNDPIAVAQGAIQHAIELAQYVEMVSNQVEQINLLTSQLSEITAYVDAFGDPSSLLKITGADEIISQLRLPSSGQLSGDLQRASSGAASLTNTGGGMFRPIESIKISGVEVPRHEELYRKFGALEDTESNYRTVHEESAARIESLKNDIADTTIALQSATTDAEVQKLQGTLASQNAQLTALQGEVQTAAIQVLVQDALNRNDKEKQEEARREQNAAEWGVINKDFDRMLTIPESTAR